MENKSNMPGNNRENDYRDQEQSNKNAGENHDEHVKPHLAPDKDRDYKVLHNDGSFADLRDKGAPGDGALEGTVGLGT